MNLSSGLLSGAWYIGFNIAFFLTLVLSLYFIHWKQLFADTGLQHRLGLALLFVVIVWSMRAGVTEGLGIHFFLITAIHLIFGWQLAIWVVALALAGMVWAGKEVLAGVGINAFISAIVPMLCTYTLWRIHIAKQGYNPFAFIFLVCFLGAVVSVVASGLLLSFVLLADGVYEFDFLITEFWMYVPLIAIPEATLNGIIVTAMIVFKPEWVKFFDADKYYRH